MARLFRRREGMAVHVLDFHGSSRVAEEARTLAASAARMTEEAATEASLSEHASADIV